MNKVEQQRYDAANKQSNGEPVGSFAELLASCSLSDGALLMTQSKNHGYTTFGSGGVVGGDDLAAFQAGPSEVIHVDLASVESAWGWSCPSREISSIGSNRESILGEEVLSFEPTDVYGSEWVMDLNTGCCENYFGSNNEYPEQSTCSSKVDQAEQSFNVSSGVEKASCSQYSNQNNKRKINPVTSGTVYVNVGHVSQTTADISVIFKDLLTKKGI